MRNGEEASIQSTLSKSKFFTSLGFELGDDSVERQLLLKVREDHLNLNGTIHGGVIATMHDNIAGMIVRFETNLNCVTVDLSIHYVKPAFQGEDLCATGTIINEGRKIVMVDSFIRTMDGALISRSTATLKVLYPPS